MNEIMPFSLVMLAAVFVAACSQILLKKSAERQYGSKLAEYLNVRVIGAYAMFSATAIASIFVLRHIPLSLVPVLESSVYVFVPILSRLFLQERLNKRKLAGIAFIIVGIVIFSL